MKLPLHTRILRVAVFCLQPVLLALLGMCLSPWQYWYPHVWGFLPAEVFLLGAVIAILVSYIWLLHTKWKGLPPPEGEMPPARRDRVPTDLFLVLCAALVFLAFWACILLLEVFDFFYFEVNLGNGIYLSNILAAGFFGITSLVVSYQMLASLVVRAKWGTLISNTLLYCVAHWLWPRLRDVVFPGCKKGMETTKNGLTIAGSKLGKGWEAISEKAGPRLLRLLNLIAREYRVLLACAVGLAVYVFLTCSLFYNYWFGLSDLPLAALVIMNLLVYPVLAAVCIQLRALFKASKHIASGDLTYKTNTEKFLRPLKTHGDNLNSIGSGLAVAVEERMKSERLKTDLITNVSHDIKTPLTSIVSYVDLMQKEDCSNETMQEYLAVLERQAARLKKLTEDLVEASKAATGSLPVTLAPTGVVEILNQALGEYSDRLAARSLQPVVTLPEDEVIVEADGRHLWRVFDNLLCNICKYAHEGTRVYVEVTQGGPDVQVTMKNISSHPLNIRSEDLMERFVRGDTSRTTEGSGLGLSIAQSLLDLQRGSFTLSIDGDLFKTVVTLPASAA